MLPERLVCLCVCVYYEGVGLGVRVCMFHMFTSFLFVQMILTHDLDVVIYDRRGSTYPYVFLCFCLVSNFFFLNICTDLSLFFF